MPSSEIPKEVKECEHINSPDYLVYKTCSTGFCVGKEVRCKKCGVYITTCSCGALNNIRMEGCQRG